MKIRDIKLRQVENGTNWKLVPNEPEWYEKPMDEWSDLIQGVKFTPDDMVIYSGLIAYPSGRVLPILLCKRVGDLEYGGDYCEYADGCWMQLGLVPMPDAEVGGREYFADPLGIDPSFVNDEIRLQHRLGFAQHIRDVLEDES